MDPRWIPRWSLLLHFWWCTLWRHTVVWRHGAFFVSRQHSTGSDFPSMTKVFLKSWLVYSSCAEQCFLLVNLKRFLMQTEQQTQERRIVNPRRGRFDTEKFLMSENADLKFNASNKEGDGSNKQRSRENITQWISNAKVLLRTNGSDFGS